MTSGGNNFNDFPVNQLTIDFAFLGKHTWWNATVSPFPSVLISFRGTAFPKKYLGDGVPRVSSWLHCWSPVVKHLFILLWRACTV